MRGGRDKRRRAQADVAAIRRLLVLAGQPGHNHEVVHLAPVSPWLQDVAAEHGLDLDGFVHALGTSAVRHVLIRHGDAEREARRGHLAVTPADFENIAEIVTQPDQVVLGFRNRIGEQVIASTKRLADGTTLVLEEVHRGRKRLALKTMWKAPGAIDASRLHAIPNLNARDVPQDELKIVVRHGAGKVGA